MKNIAANIAALLGMLQCDQMLRVCAFTADSDCDPMLAKTIRDQTWKVSPQLTLEEIRTTAIATLTGALLKLPDGTQELAPRKSFSLKEIDTAFAPFGLPGSLRPPISVRINSYTHLSLVEVSRVIDALRYVVSAVRWLENDYRRDDRSEALFLDLAVPMLDLLEDYPHDLLTITRDEIRRLEDPDTLVVFVRKDRMGNWSFVRRPGVNVSCTDDELQWNLACSPMARSISRTYGVLPYRGTEGIPRMAA